MNTRCGAGYDCYEKAHAEMIKKDYNKECIFNRLGLLYYDDDNINEKDLKVMIEKSDKRRQEILDGKIGALYGHSTPQKIVKEPSEPPATLYHGTPRYFLDSIKKKGIVPKSRQYVHLGVDIEIATQVGKRRDENPAILVIDAKKAWEDGVTFYKGNDKVWLTDFVDSKYINIVKGS